MSYNFISVFLGGGLGCTLRYAMQMIMKAYLPTMNFPLPIFTINVLGCFLIGLFYALSDHFGLSDNTRLLLTTGLCGGFTTFSTFSDECLGLIKQGHWGEFSGYVVLSVLLGICAVFAGGFIGQHIK